MAARVTPVSILRALGRIFEAGRVYKGLSPMHWCRECGSPLAEAGIEYHEGPGKTVDAPGYESE